ncbi:MAG: hypothetical protein C7B46_20920 [Sulfobacillus benefaciens]|uniref:Uncharacterized protein n=1 Tax=Sulfobacillus benefaciens TaxID=453960 RepID=A0A2T2WR64_9FIRM|nr:MAG: hypothetical protein C7B46_20920 [Sulfobacillus benefaciens]
MIIPRRGDIWEYQLPGQRKKRKEIGTITRQRRYLSAHSQPLRVFIAWKRRPKGRYSGIWPKALLRYGRRVSTRAEREAAFAARIAERKAARDISQEGPSGDIARIPENLEQKR